MRADSCVLKRVEFDCVFILACCGVLLLAACWVLRVVCRLGGCVLARVGFCVLTRVGCVCIGYITSTLVAKSVAQGRILMHYIYPCLQVSRASPKHVLSRLFVI